MVPTELHCGTLVEHGTTWNMAALFHKRVPLRNYDLLVSTPLNLLRCYLLQACDAFAV